MQDLRIYFSDFFHVSRQTIKSYGVFDVSLINDLPMFIDPFLLFNSEKPEYQVLHAEMIRYVKFLRNKSIGAQLERGRMYAWYIFKEIKQNWLGFSLSGNRGRGLGPDFATALHKNFNTAFRDFGEEDVPESPHFEKLTWFASAFDVNSEANSGRGPVDFAISKGSSNKALAEFKLASKPSTRRQSGAPN